MSTDEIESRTLRQADYDAYFKDLMESEGLSVEEAAEQSIESISSQYDTFNLFLYRNKRELDEKVKVESRCVTIEKAGKGTDSFINANFAFQGLLKILKDSDEYTRKGIWHIFESRSLLKSLVYLLRVVPDEEDESKKAVGEIDSDEEDEDEAKILQTIAVLEFSKVIIELALASPKKLHNIEAFLTVDCDMAEILKSRLDEDSAEARVVNKMIDLLVHLFAAGTNKAVFLEASMSAVLDFTKKMQKKNAGVLGKLNSLSSMLV